MKFGKIYKQLEKNKTLLIFVIGILIIVSISKASENKEYFGFNFGKKKTTNINTIMNDTINAALTTVSTKCTSNTQQDQTIDITCRSDAGEFAFKMTEMCMATSAAQKNPGICKDYALACGIYDVSQDQSAQVLVTCMDDNEFHTKMQQEVKAELEKKYTENKDGTAVLMEGVAGYLNPQVSIGNQTTTNKNTTINTLKNIVSTEFSKELKADLNQLQKIKIDAGAKTEVSGLHQEQSGILVAKALSNNKVMKDLQNTAYARVQDINEKSLTTDRIICVIFIFYVLAMSALFAYNATRD